MIRTYLGLGSNLGDSRGIIEGAVRALGSVLSGLERAPLYETAPQDVEDQPRFLNTVVSGTTGMAPEELLAAVQKIEDEAGRVREGVVRRGPRTLDIDILLYGEEVLDGADLTVPHPRMDVRQFVLRPLLDLDPGLKDPRDGIPWRDKADALADQDVLLYTGETP